MEFKGTKGKWVFDDVNMVITGEGIIESMTVIANVSPRMNYTRGMTTQCANAQLISSAPELLVALQLLANGVRKRGCAGHLSDYLKQADTIIAKALGKEADDE